MIRKRLFARWLLACFLGLAGTLLALPAGAQQQQYYTYVSFWVVPRANWTQMENFMNQTKPTMEKLVANGTITNWGLERNMIHDPEGWTHITWMTAPSRAGILEAIDALRGSFTSASVLAGVKHWDIFLETMNHGGKTVRLEHGYGAAGIWRVKPGHGDDWVAFVHKYIKPMLDQMLADGTILMYNIDTSEFNTDAAPSDVYDIAVVFPSAKAVDTFFDRFNAYWHANPAVIQTFLGLAVPNSERDLLAEELAYQHK